MAAKGKRKIGIFALILFSFLLFITLLRSRVRQSPDPAFAHEPASAPMTQLISTNGCRTPVGSRDNNPLTKGPDNILVTATAGWWRSPAASRRHFEEDDWLDELVERIWQVEAGGRLNPPPGDGGRAVGPLQIHTCVIDDVNYYFGTDFSYEDRHDLDKSKQIARLYMMLWMMRHGEEIAARIYKGGPRGWRKRSTDEYWRKIEGVK